MFIMDDGEFETTVIKHQDKRMFIMMPKIQKQSSGLAIFHGFFHGFPIQKMWHGFFHGFFFPGPPGATRGHTWRSGQQNAPRNLGADLDEAFRGLRFDDAMISGFVWERMG